jgi:hypothetical protein
MTVSFKKRVPFEAAGEPLRNPNAGKAGGCAGFERKVWTEKRSESLFLIGEAVHCHSKASSRSGYFMAKCEESAELCA